MRQLRDWIDGTPSRSLLASLEGVLGGSENLLLAGLGLVEVDRVLHKMLESAAVDDVAVLLDRRVKASELVRVLLVEVDRLGVRAEVLELVEELGGLLVELDVLGVTALEAVLPLDAPVSVGGAIAHRVGDGLVVGEEVTELLLELDCVVKLGGGARALEVEPQDGVELAAVDKDLVLQGLLEEAVHVVVLECTTLDATLHRRLVEGVHLV